MTAGPDGVWPEPQTPEASGSHAPETSFVADGRWHPVDRRYVRLQRWGGWIGVGVLLVLMLPAGAVFLIVSAPPPLVSLGLGGMALIVGAGLAVLAHAWPPLAYQHLGYKLDASGIEIRRGVVWRRALNVPRSRVQHTDINQGPLERSLGLAHIVIHTAGTISASVTLEGLSLKAAEGIRDYLMGSLSDDAV